MNDAEFDAMLATHLLRAEYLHSSNAEAFFADRREEFLAMVEEAIGKPVVRDVDEEDLTGGLDGPDAVVDSVATR